MLSSNLRGGMSFASERYCESAVYEDINNQARNLDSKNRFNVILDIDANNLYGCSQTFPLPYKDFEFVSIEEKQKINWKEIDLMKDKGYFVEVTLSYPENIHSKTASFPLCPQNTHITYDMLSPFQKDVLFKVYGKKTYKSKKLTSTFQKKEKIVLHALNLQLYLKLGMEIEEIFRVVSFSQKPYMKEWVEYCTSKRMNAKNEFEKNFWKLMVNCVFGKTIESVFERKIVKIITNPKQFAFYVKQPNYENHIIVTENISIVVLSKETAKVIRPYYIGFSILEISKLIMYDYFYNVLQPFFGQDGVQLLYTDTDSLVLKLRTCNILSDLHAFKQSFDFSNLCKSHELYSDTNKAVLFKFKEEFGLRPISRFCALKSKVYSFEVACEHKDGFNEKGVCKICRNKSFSGENFNRLKGVQKRTAREIHFEKYLLCLFQKNAQRDKNFQICSKKQKISTKIVNKISLSCFDDKRYLLNCGIHSEPYSLKNSSFCMKCHV